MPPEIVKLHNDAFSGIDAFHSNGSAFFVAVSLKFKLVATKEMTNENVKTISNCIESVVKIHNERNPCIATIAGNNKFDCLKPILKEKCDIECNMTKTDKHAAEVKHMI